MLIPKCNHCGTLYTWAVKNGYQRAWNSTPQPGDLVIFDFSGNHASCDHVGFVIAVGNGNITTIEGNTSVTSNDNGGNVMQRVRYPSQVRGYVRPLYTDKYNWERLLAIVKAELGTKEKPSGSNCVKYNTWYYGAEVQGTAYPWCMVFVSWCFYELDRTADAGKPDEISVKLLQIQEGAQNDAVVSLQILLRGWGCDPGEVDGIFGPMTKKAVIDYQIKYELEIDGIVGPRTWHSLLT